MRLGSWQAIVGDVRSEMKNTLGIGMVAGSNNRSLSAFTSGVRWAAWWIVPIRGGKNTSGTVVAGYAFAWSKGFISPCNSIGGIGMPHGAWDWSWSRG